MAMLPHVDIDAILSGLVLIGGLNVLQGMDIGVNYAVHTQMN